MSDLTTVGKNAVAADGLLEATKAWQKQFGDRFLIAEDETPDALHPKVMPVLYCNDPRLPDCNYDRHRIFRTSFSTGE